MLTFVCWCCKWLTFNVISTWCRLDYSMLTWHWLTSVVSNESSHSFIFYVSSRLMPDFQPEEQQEQKLKKSDWKNWRNIWRSLKRQVIVITRCLVTTITLLLQTETIVTHLIVLANCLIWERFVPKLSLQLNWLISCFCSFQSRVSGPSSYTSSRRSSEDSVETAMSDADRCRELKVKFNCNDCIKKVINQ